MKWKKKLFEIVTETAVKLAGRGYRYGKTRIERRMKIIKLAEAMIVTKVICTFVGCHSSIVWRWKNRNDVAGLPRSGRPSTFSESQQLRLIGFYCQTLSKCGGRWRFRTAACDLSDHPENMGSFSKSTINRKRGHVYKSEYFKVLI